MKRGRLILMLCALACLTLSAYAVGKGKTPRAPENVFRARLEGVTEVPPVTTTASGIAIFHLNKEMNAMNYRLLVRELVEPTGAHLHLGAAGKNGDPIVMLYPAEEKTPPPAPAATKTKTTKPTKPEKERLLAKGIIRPENLVGPLAGKTLNDLVEKIKAGEVYVNIHTKAHPDGEIRGQLTVSPKK